ncbi:MAG TPA: hypothetical protein GXZ59_05490, partial [Clostridiaceae bacterium]|nr:hypothetical protein [Clostridiaceae bacterium]
MSQLNLHGKTKADLTVIAQVAGLLTSTEARKMTKKQLLDFLLHEEDKLGQGPAEKESESEIPQKQAAKKGAAPKAKSEYPAASDAVSDIASEAEPEVSANDTGVKAVDKRGRKSPVRKTKDIRSEEKPSQSDDQASADKDKAASSSDIVSADSDQDA